MTIISQLSLRAHPAPCAVPRPYMRDLGESTPQPLHEVPFFPSLAEENTEVQRVTGLVNGGAKM